MRKIILLASLFLVIVATNCKKIDALLTFYVEDSESLKVSSGFPLGQVVPLTPITVTTRSDETFKNNNTSANLVKDVSLNKLTLTIMDPPAQNFDFLKSIKIYISTNSNDKILLASLDQVPQGVQSITLVPSNVKLDSYLKAASYTLSTEAVISSRVPQDVTLKADSRFKVTADPL